jgi:Flp pilus assembly protein TadD
MKALIKRASFSIFLIVSAPFSAFADLIDAQRALLNGQFSKALEFSHDIADTHPVDAALISARALIELGNPKEAERYASFAVRVAPYWSARNAWAQQCV